MNQDKINAYMTLYTVLETVTRLAAPYRALHDRINLSEPGGAAASRQRLRVSISVTSRSPT